MVNVQSRSRFNPLTAKLFHWEFRPPEVSENYSDLTNGGQQFFEILLSRFIFNMFNVPIKMN